MAGAVVATAMMEMMGPSMIEVIDTISLSEAFHSTVAALPFTYGWRSNQQIGFAHWNHECVKVHKRNVTPIEVPAPYNELWQALKANLPDGAYPIRCYANQHFYGHEGAPHRDGDRDNETTTVLYINREWKREWGGETAFYQGQEIIKSVMPKFGRLVMFPSNITHCARAVSRICPLARVTFMIKARHPDPECMELENFLGNVGADKLPHKHGTLRDHCVRVYEILTAKGASRETRIAGGLHSAYGTRSYKYACLTDRNIIRGAFGQTVEGLVYAFSTNGPDDATCDELQLMRAANLKDQGALKKHPELQQFWDNYPGSGVR